MSTTKQLKFNLCFLALTCLPAIGFAAEPSQSEERLAQSSLMPAELTKNKEPEDPYPILHQIFGGDTGCILAGDLSALDIAESTLQILKSVQKVIFAGDDELLEKEIQTLKEKRERGETLWDGFLRAREGNFLMGVTPDKAEDIILNKFLSALEKAKKEAAELTTCFTCFQRDGNLLQEFSREKEHFGKEFYSKDYVHTNFPYTFAKVFGKGSWLNTFRDQLIKTQESLASLEKIFGQRMTKGEEMLEKYKRDDLIQYQDELTGAIKELEEHEWEKIPN